MGCVPCFRRVIWQQETLDRVQPRRGWLQDSCNPRRTTLKGTKGERPDSSFQRMELHLLVLCDEHLFHFVRTYLWRWNTGDVEDKDGSDQQQCGLLQYRAVLVPVGCARKWLKVSLTAVPWHVCSHCLFCPVTPPCFSSSLFVPQAKISQMCCLTDI